MNWLGYGPEGNEEPRRERETQDAPGEAAASKTSLPPTASPVPRETRPVATPGAGVAAGGPTPSAEEWRVPTDRESAAPAETQTTEDRIQAAAASAAEAAEQHAVDEVVALEQDLERAKREAAERLGELEGRLAPIETRAGEAERGAEEARRRLAEAERLRADAEEAHGVREQELEGERAAIERELAETRRQLDEARDRAIAAERRASESEAEREREPRAQAIEGDTEPADEDVEADEVTEPGDEVTEPADEVTESDDVADAGQVVFRPAGEVIKLSEATFDDLRSLGMSVTQAKRVLDYRQRLDGFDSLDDLDFVPGFPKSFLTQVKARVTL